MVGAVDHLPCFKDLIAVLFECFLIISLGYLSARFKLISARAKDLNSYLTTFALPMIIFLNIAQMEFQTIDLSFLICILTAKLLVFIIVTLLTLTISHPTNFGYAGSLSILTTQSNDFALGYPLIKSLYGESKQEMLSYLSLMAPIQLLILNPLGIVMLEFHKSRKAVRRRSEDCCHQSNPKQPPPSPATAPTQSVGIVDTEMNEANHQLRLRKKMVKPPSTPTSTSLSFHLTSEIIAELDSSNNQDTTNSPDQSKDRPGCCPTRRVEQLKGFQHRNIRSLKLVIPPTGTNVITDETTSNKSIDNLTQFDSSNENEFVNYSAYPASTINQATSTNYNHFPKSIINDQSACTPPITGTNQTCSYETNASSPLSIKVIANSRSPSPNDTCRNDSRAIKLRMFDLGFLKELATNPLIIASVVALFVNLTHGPELPKFVTRVSNTIAASFASPALFVVGVSMYGKFELLKKNPNDLLLSSVLVLTKGFLLPNIMRTLALIMLPKSPVESSHYLVDFAFLYGLLPTAPTACIIANQYGILSNVVSISMILSTFLSAPLMLTASVIINPSSVIKPADIDLVITQTMKVSSVITLSLAALTLYSFWKSRRSINYTNFINFAEVTVRSIDRIKKNPTQVFLVLLAVCQALAGLGGLIWYFVDTSKLETTSPLVSHYLRKRLEPANIPNLTVDTNLNLILQHGTVASPVPDPTPDTIQPLINELATMIPPPVAEPETQINQLVAPSALESVIYQQRHLDLANKILSTGYYVFSSYGLMMAKFVILCLIVTIAAKKIKGHQLASKLSLLMVKIYAILSTCLVVWLLLDSNSLTHLPIEATLPNHTSSLCIRLIFDVIFLVAALPGFAYIIKSNNKTRDELHKDNVGPGVGNLVSRRFVTSSLSLSSDTDSAMTTNTNLESSSSNSHQWTQMTSDTNNNHPVNPQNEHHTILSDDDIYDSMMNRPISQADIQILPPQNVIHVNRDSTSVEHRTMSTSIDNDQNPSQYKLVDPTNDQRIPHRCNNQLIISEFNKYSILIVFMMVNSAHNLTAIMQKLLQNQPYGTFRQIEVINVALEFGQGLITFLVYGMKGLFR